MWTSLRRIFLDYFQGSLEAARIIRVEDSLFERVFGSCRCLRNVFSAWPVLSGQTYSPPRIDSNCEPFTETPIYMYIQGSASNRHTPSVGWYFRFYSIITFSSGILYVISSVLPSDGCLVTRVVSDFLNLPSMYYICLYRVWYYYLLCILRTCVAAVTFPSSYISSERLVRYLMIRDSA